MSIPLHAGSNIDADAQQARRAIEGGTMARRRFQNGSLFRRGKRQKVWVARWREDVIRPDGSIGRKRCAEIIGTVAEYPTRRRAMQVLSERLRPINSGTHKPQSIRTFRDFVQQEWMPTVLPTLKYATQEHYRYLLNVHLLPAFGGYRISEIDRETIQSFLAAKLNSGLAWKSVKHLRGALSRVLGTAEQWCYILDNPTSKTKLPRRPQRRTRSVCTPASIRRLLDQLHEPARSLVLLLALTGLRIGELLALRWGNINLEEHTLRVTETVYDGHFDTPKSERSVRTIPIGTEAATVFQRLRPQNPESGDLVFVTRKGRPLNRRDLLRRQLRPACQKLGLTGLNWHALRHSHATMLDSVGAPLGTVQALLGHSDPEITREVYMHAIPDDQRRAVERVERLILDSSGLN